MARPTIDDGPLLAEMTRLVLTDRIDCRAALHRVAGDREILRKWKVVGRGRVLRQRAERKFREADCRDERDLRLLMIDPRLPRLARLSFADGNRKPL
jgi:hypothetical protein